MKKILEIWNRIGRWISGAALFLMMLLTATDVFGRYILHAPITGTGELTEFLMVIFIFLALSDITSSGGHISVEFVTQQLSERKRTVLSGLASILSGVAIGIVAWRLGANALYTFHYPEMAPVLNVSKAPFIAVAAFGCAMATLAFLGLAMATLTKANKDTDRNKEC